jgi:hypothetical protein
MIGLAGWLAGWLAQTGRLGKKGIKKSLWHNDGDRTLKVEKDSCDMVSIVH